MDVSLALLAIALIAIAVVNVALFLRRRDSRRVKGRPDPSPWAGWSKERGLAFAPMDEGALAYGES
jgi:hypothetical protein